MTGATLLLLLAVAAPAQLVITSGGRRVFDREPDTADTNCLGWTYGPSPALGDHGELVGMYVASDALAQHCKVGIESAVRFGDAIRFHALRTDGSWTPGVNVVDRASLEWMTDTAFLEQNLQTYAGHVASPSVVHRDGRWFMAFAVSRDDRNLCAGEHYSGNACGSCLDPWSYFVIAWAVSDDGVNWRVRERAPGDPTFLGRAPAPGERAPSSSYKGLTRVSLLSFGDFFYLAAQYWAADGLHVVMVRAPYDRADQWGLGGAPEAVPTSLAGTLGSITRTRNGFLALSSASNRIYYQTSTNLTNWSPPVLLRSSIPFFADGFGYETSVIDPVAVEDADGKLHLFFASADGDPDHGVGRDGHHDCGLYSGFGPTAAYLGTGIYEGIMEPRNLHPTTTTLVPRGNRLEVRVSAPAGNAVISDNGAFTIVPLVNGLATIELTPGDHQLYAWFDAQGDWDASRSAFVAVHVSAPKRRAAR